ncbi:hypothetical protein V6Z12_D02G028000 [Gossypium hirsutum]
MPTDTSKPMKLERYNSYIRKVHSTKLLNASSKFLFRVTLLIALVLILFFTINYPPLSDNTHSAPHHHHRHSFLSTSLFSGSSLVGGAAWEKQVRHSSTPRRVNGFSVLVTGAAGFIGSHCSLALKKRGDGVLGLDNFNDYYDPSLKRARQNLLSKHQIFIVEGDLNDGPLLTKLFDVVPFTHVLHLAAQAGVRTQDQKAVARDFTYIDDVVKGCLGALDTAEKSTGSGGKKKGPAQLRVYNLGNTSPVPVGRLVSILEGLLNTKAKKHVVTLPRNGDVPYTHANVTLAYKDFGYKPTTDLSSGLRKFVKWYVNYFGIESKHSKETQHFDESS